MEGEGWRIRIKKERKDTLRKEDVVKCINGMVMLKEFKTKEYQKEIATATMEERREREIASKRRKDEVDGGLNIMGIESRQAVTRDRSEWRKTVLEAKAYNGL
jgi:hypothetical protein